MLLLAAVYAYSFFFNAAQGSPRPLVFLALACLLGAATTALLTQAGKMHFQQTITAANLINVGHSLLKLGYLTLIAPNHDLLMLTLRDLTDLRRAQAEAAARAARARPRRSAADERRRRHHPGDGADRGGHADLGHRDAEQRDHPVA